MNQSAPCDALLVFPRESFTIFEYMPPLGLLSIAGVLQQHGFTVNVIDGNRYAGDVTADLRRWRPRIVGIGGTTPTRKTSFALARTVKSVWPDVPVVYGGCHASFAVEDTLRHVPQIDYIVQGEGEYPFLALCRHFVRGETQDLAALPGLAWRTGAQVRTNRPQRIENLDALPIPDRAILGTYRMGMEFLDGEADFLVTSRGCPAACSFCSAARMFPGGVRLRSMAHVHPELEQIMARKKITGLKLFDSTFTADRNHVLAFCRMVQPYRLQWECEVRADTVDRELLAAMRAAGCFYIDIGLETTSERMQQALHKHVTTAQVEQVLAWARELGIRTKVFFIFGLLDQTYVECKRDTDYLRAHRKQIDLFATTIGLRVYPGTAVERELRQRAWLPEKFSWAQFRPSRLQWLVLEPADTLVLCQPQLGFRHLVFVILRLVRQGTVLAPQYIGMLERHNIKSFAARFVTNINRGGAPWPAGAGDKR
jgi:radical SAM superfamily enzyme YgiQ (UPF0313 family)